MQVCLDFSLGARVPLFSLAQYNGVNGGYQVCSKTPDGSISNVNAKAWTGVTYVAGDVQIIVCVPYTEYECFVS